MSEDAIQPDTKDWTWTLARRCPECGFEASGVEVAQIGAVIRETLPRWTTALGRSDAGVRPDPAVWSTLEYGAHVRDVFRVFEGRLTLLLTEDDPQFANWDQDAAAVEGGYSSLDPAVVADELTEAGERVARGFDAVTPDQHERPGRRSNGSVFTVRTLGQYMTHDIVHHLHDVGA